MRQWILVNIVVIMLEDDISLKEMIFLYKKTQPECKQYAAYEEKGLL